MFGNIFADSFKRGLAVHLKLCDTPVDGFEVKITSESLAIHFA